MSEMPEQRFYDIVYINEIATLTFLICGNTAMGEDDIEDLAKDTLRDLVSNVNAWSFVSFIDVEYPE